MLFTCIPDENFQMSFAPQFKESDFKFTFKDKSTAYVYLQDNIKSFLDFLIDNFNIVIYHTGHEEYANKVFEIIDPNNKFKIKYGREFCHLYFNQENEVIEYVRDINLFSDISIKRKVILDSGSISNICNPDNVFVFNKFNPDNPIESLDEIKSKLEELKEYDDVREYLIPEFKMRQMLINTRLI